MMDCAAFFRDGIARWEGGLSLDPDDGGNWYAPAGHVPVLIGSNHGVTGAALAAWRGNAAITADDMARLTLDEAVQIAERLYWRAPGLDRLPWDPATAAMADFGWGAGPAHAVALAQHLVGARADGCVGPDTVAAYRAFAAAHGVEQAARSWCAARGDFYRRLVARRPPVDARYLNGWMRRAASFLPGTAWWRRFGWIDHEGGARPG